MAGRLTRSTPLREIGFSRSQWQALRKFAAKLGVPPEIVVGEAIREYLRRH